MSIKFINPPIDSIYYFRNGERSYSAIPQSLRFIGGYRYSDLRAGVITLQSCSPNICRPADTPATREKPARLSNAGQAYPLEMKNK
jgi:hypothetical protein